jgi:hypothetical protein
MGVLAFGRLVVYVPTCPFGYVAATDCGVSIFCLGRRRRARYWLIGM